MKLALFLSLSIFACSFGLLRGGKPERIVALSFAAAILATMRAPEIYGPQAFKQVALTVALVDCLLLAILAGISLAANRYWTIVVAGLQLTTVAGHALKMLSPSIIPQSYLFLTSIWSWPMMVALVAGTLKHRHRLLIQSVDRDWKPSPRRQESINAK